MRFSLYSLFALSVMTLLAQNGMAEEKALSPYIDAVKKELPEEAPRESYTEEMKKKLGTPSKEGTYIEGLRDADPLRDEVPSRNYTEQERQRLKPAETQSAIEAVALGKSDLKLRKEGPIHHAAGFRMGTNLTRDITASAGSGQRLFNDVYGTDWVPDVTFFYEYQPFHSEWFGNIGLMASIGTSYYKGTGTFAVSLTNPTTGTAFPSESRTTFNFLVFPATLGINYRFNLLRFVRPYVMGGASGVAYFESRNDSRDGFKGKSTALFMSGGVAFLLDWISRTSNWDLYADSGIQHSYLTVDYTRMSPISGAVSFEVSGVTAGLTFEY